MKKIISMLVVTLFVLAGCGSSQSISLGGSTSVEPLASVYIEEYTAENPSAQITYDAQGSGAAIEGLQNDTYDVGFLSRELKDDEQDGTITTQVIAYDGIAVIVNPENPVTDLTQEEILGIYTGEITDWSEVGGEPGEISVVSRESGSGTRSAFEELVGFGEGGDVPLSSNAIQASSNGEVAQTVAGNPNAIGYVSFATVEETDGITAVSVDGVAPTSEDVLNGSYTLARPFVMAYQEEDLDEDSQAFVDWVNANQDTLAEQEGYIAAGAK